MSSETVTINPRCHCGRFDHTFTLPESNFPLVSTVCCCTMCRRATGNLFTTWVSIQGGYTNIPADHPATKLPDLSKAVAYKFSEGSDYWFCPECGSRLLSTWPGGWGFASGLIGHVEKTPLMKRLIEFVVEDHTGDGGPGVWLTEDGLKAGGEPVVKFADAPFESKEVSNEELKELAEKTKQKVKELDAARTKDDKLSFTCACGGIKGHITRPNDSTEAHPKRGHWWLKNGKYKCSPCNCDSCRICSGFEIFTWLYIPFENVFFDGDESSVDFDKTYPSLQHYKSSEHVLRSFCKGCGATVFYRRDNRTGPTKVVDFAPGFLESKAGSRAEDWLYWLRDPGFEREAIDLEFAKLLNDGVEKYEAEMAAA